MTDITPTEIGRSEKGKRYVFPINQLFLSVAREGECLAWEGRRFIFVQQ